VSVFECVSFYKTNYIPRRHQRIWTQSISRMNNSSIVPAVKGLTNNTLSLSMVMVHCVTCLLNTVAFLAMYRTTRTPRLCRFHSLCLSAMHIAAAVVLVVVNCTHEFQVRVYFVNVSGTITFITFYTVSLMSFDRMLLFAAGLRYIQIYTFKKGVRVSVAVWIIVGTFHLTTLGFVCGERSTVIPDNCKTFLSYVVFPLIIFNVLFCYVCYVIIFIKVKIAMRHVHAPSVTVWRTKWI
jgi:hypothetical protein